MTKPTDHEIDEVARWMCEITGDDYNIEGVEYRKIACRFLISEEEIATMRKEWSHETNRPGD